MQKQILSTALAAVIPFPTAVLAEATLDDRLEGAEQRIHYLERRLLDQERSLKEQPAEDNWFDRIEIGGLIEVEAGWEDPDSGDTESGLTLATAELGISGQITSMLSAEVVLLYEDDGEEELDVDVAAITLTPTDTWSITAGQFYVPFGLFESGMLSDPLTLELGETRETAVNAHFTSGIFGLSAYVFDGDASEQAESKIDNFGLDLGLTQTVEAFSYTANLGYINDIGDSDGLIDYAGDIHDRVAGMAASVVVVSGPFSVIGEYVGALDEFNTGEEPSAFNLEAGYAFQLAGREAGVAIGMQGTDDAEGVGLPEEVMIAALSFEVVDSAALGIEYARAEDYDGEETGILTLQLAAEF